MDYMSDSKFIEVKGEIFNDFHKLSLFFKYELVTSQTWA